MGEFTVIIPTATRYIESVGGSASLAGLVVGTRALGTALIQPLIGVPLKKYPLKRIMLCLCGVNFAGSILYALGGLTGSVATIIVARVIQGLGSGPTWMSTYVTRTTSTDLRSTYMQYLSLSVGLGYGVGPFFGAALYALCDRRGLDLHGKVFNAYTSPGWLWALFFVVEFLLLKAFMIEPEKSKAANALGGAPAPDKTGIPWRRLFLIFPIISLVPLNVGGWDVHTVLLGEQRFGWSIVATALYLGGLNWLAVPAGLIPASTYVGPSEDRCGVLGAFGLLLAATACFWNYGGPVASRAIVYGVGSVALLVDSLFAKSFSWSLVSKQPPPEHRTYVMACNSGAYMFGRGCGATVAGFLPPGDAFAIFLLAVEAFAIVYILVLWRYLTIPEGNSSSESTHVPA